MRDKQISRGSRQMEKHGRHTNLRVAAACSALVAALSLVVAVGGADARGVAAPTNSAPPTISGTPELGQTLTTNGGVWSGSPTSFTYQWRNCDANGANCSDIAGAKSKTYTLQQADVGNTVRIRVTAINSDGSASSTSVPSAVIRGAPKSAPVRLAT